MQAETMIMTVLLGASSGFAMALFGWFKSQTTTTPEPFDVQKFVTTVLLGTVVGGVAAGLGQPLDQTLSYMASIGAVAAIETLGKTIARWIQAKFPKQPAIPVPPKA